MIRNNLTGLMISRQHTFKNNNGQRDALNFVRQFSKRDPHLKTFHQSGFLVSRETVVLPYVGGRVKQKFGSIERVDKIMLNYHRERFGKLTLRALALC